MEVIIMNAITVNSLTKIYKQRQRKSGFVAAIKTFFHDDTVYKTAVDDVSFTVEEGDIIGLLGPNGAGKTTVLKILSGILYPTKGSVEIVGHTPHFREDEFKKKIALIVGQKNQMIWDLPAIDTLLWLKEIYDIERPVFDESVKKLSTIFQAEDLLNLQVRRMSLGQRMKMELIASMIHNPKVVFLDEPTIGLDVMAQNSLREYVKEYNRHTGATVILTSHNLLDVEVLCKKVILINDGKVTYNNSLEDLITTYCDHKVITLQGIREKLTRTVLPDGITIVSEKEEIVILNVKNEICRDAIRFILANFTLDDFRVEDIGINEIIIKAFADKERNEVT